MDLTKMFLNTYTSGADTSIKYAAPSNPQKSASTFESYLNKESRKSVTSAEGKTNSSKETKDKVNSDKTEKNDAKVEPVKSQKTSEKKTSVKDTKSAEKADVSEKPAGEINEEIVKAIAEETGLSIDEIAAVLESLNIQAVDLAEPNNLLSFMMKLADVDNAIDLISIDGVKEIMAEIKNVFAESDEFTQFAQKAAAVAETDVEEDAETEVVEVETESVSKTDSVKAEVSNDTALSDKTETKSDSNVVSAQSGVVEEITVDSEKLREDRLSVKDFSRAAENTEQPVEKVVQSIENQSSAGGNLLKNTDHFRFSKNDVKPEVSVSGIVMDNITKAFNAAAVRTESARNVDTAEVVQQIIEKIKVGINRDVTEIKISLKPEELGDVTVKIASQNGVVTAQITAESQRVKEIIESGFNQLKQALSDAGVEVSQLEVNVGSGDGDVESDDQSSSNEKSSSRINSIIADIEGEEKGEDVYAKENEVVGASVNYMA